MSKKKQLTGKQTKLAKLPLTQVLSQGLSDTETPWEPRPLAEGPPEPESSQMPFSWEQLEEGAQGLLAAAYALILKDLLVLRAGLADGSGVSPVPFEPAVPDAPPPLPVIKQALRQVKQDLGELSQLLLG